jgi:DMSO/TMAO reductase YedYZ molybdopterin-dependent catalytic subunit
MQGNVKTPPGGTSAFLRGVDGMVRMVLPALAAGVVASLLATAVMMLLRLELGVVTLPELVGERILPNLDAGTFVQLLIQFGKIRPLAYALTGQIVLGILVAPLHPLLACWLAPRLGAGSRGRWPSRAEWLAAGLLALGMWLVALVLFWPVLAENLLGFDVGAARAITAAGLLGIFASYGVALALVYSAIQPATPAARQADGANGIARRTLLARAGIAAVAGLVLGGLSVDALIQALWTRSNLAYEGMETPPPPPAITPNAEFYVVSKNVLDPGVILSDWALEVGGLVRRPGSYDLPALRALPSETRAITLECIANGVNGHLISTAVWRGVRLETLLAARGGVAPEGKHVLFTSADGYQSSLPLADLLAVGTLLAWEMNGQPLPTHHGFPLRVVVPGRFGEQSAKWLTRVEIVDHPIKGFYQSQGWYSGPVYTISRIDAPGKGQRLPVGQIVHMQGIAYGGARGIAAVEVSTDSGQTWQPAALDPALSQQTWTLWRYDWTPSATGPYTLIVRAADGTGALQIARDQGTVPNGGTGLHRVPVVVS